MSPETINDEQFRFQILSAAAETISDGGVTALSLAAIAQECKTSPAEIESQFGSKEELVVEVALAAANSFIASQTAARQTADPITDLVTLGWAYREWALGNPDLYQVMFGGRLAWGAPLYGRGEDVTPVDEAIKPLVDRVRRAQGTGRARTTPAIDVAWSIWSVVHGWMSLELVGQRTDADYEQLYATQLEMVNNYWFGESES